MTARMEDIIDLREAIGGMLDLLTEQMKANFDHADRRMDDIAERITAIESHMTQMGTDFAWMETQIEQLVQGMTKLMQAENND